MIFMKGIIDRLKKSRQNDDMPIYTPPDFVKEIVDKKPVSKCESIEEMYDRFNESERWRKEQHKYMAARDHWSPFCLHVWLTDKSVSHEDMVEFVKGASVYLAISSKEFIQNMTGIEMYKAHNPECLRDIRSRPTIQYFRVGDNIKLVP